MKTADKILMVDPSDFVRDTFADYLKVGGFEVRAVANGERAVKMLETWEPDLIVMEIVLPGMGGTGFLKRISSGQGRPKCPVVVFTSEPGMAGFCKGLPIDAFLYKSVYGGELIRVIRETLNRRVAEPLLEAVPARTRILLAEDDGPVADHIQRTFLRAGYEVEIVASGPDVIARARELKHDIMVMKEVLSGMNGSAVAASLKSTGQTRKIPIVLYDPVPAFGASRFQSRLPDGVSAFVPTVEATVLLQEVKRVLATGARPVTVTGPSA